MPYRTYRPRTNPWVSALGTAAILAGLVALFVTLVEWVLNPHDLFHGDPGTDWGVVWETWTSWFLPTLLILAPIAAGVAWWRSQRR